MTLSKPSNRTSRRTCLGALLAIAAALAGVALADVPNRVALRGTVPNPGTQQQELTNITFPFPYNVFEFTATCGACHGGQVDQQVAHFGNWAGSSMASAARDPVFRANQIIVNRAIQQAIGQDGAGNMCMRCHSPNGWYSGRFDPFLAGSGDGSGMLHSILLSTDDEGVLCEMCHRTSGSVTFRRADLDPNEPAWNMMAGIDDWPHAGMPYVDQDGDPTITPGNPYGDTALQITDNMTYNGRYPGNFDYFIKDSPLLDTLGNVGGIYTGQTYGVYPPGWIDAAGNLVEGKPVVNPDGSLPLQYEVPIAPPTNPDGSPNYQAQSVSLEHSTVRYPNLSPAPGFVQTPEFCGTCHELTIPVLNHGMPEQRTYTEWKFSAFGRAGPDRRTCQDCHMPRLSHEFSDTVTGSYNADPPLSGWFPYSKARTNTAVHKLAGANRDLPDMMKALYPEVDIEVIGGGEGANGVFIGTGNDPRIFPGLLSTRDSMWDRNRRNTEISLRDGVSLDVVAPPTLLDPATGKWAVQVKVTNNSGHRLPSGYPDGRRMWISLEVRDATGQLVYQSGAYDEATATLFTDASGAPLRRALTSSIDATAALNAVMVYERVTGTCVDDNADGLLDACDPSPSVLNDFILFDNRIPPFGFRYADYRLSGVKFRSYDPATFVPFEDLGRYPDGVNYDLVTYTFTAPADATLSARAATYWQTHTRELMEHLRASDTSTVRPEGPPRPWNPNYPLAPNYLSDELGLADVILAMQADTAFQPPATLNDNWGGLAYAAWYVTGKGAPYLVALADTAVAAPPPPPATLDVYPIVDPVTGAITLDPATGQALGGVFDPNTGLLEPYTQRIRWDRVEGADGYLLWIQYGAGATTASWDRLAIVPQPAAGPVELINTSINLNKTYGYKVQAFNGKGYGPESATVYAKTPWDIPLEPLNLACTALGDTSARLTWLDQSDNELGFIVQRQDPLLDQTSPNGPLGFRTVATIPTPNGPGFGGMSWVDTGLLPGHAYNYQVGAYNAAGVLFSLPATCTTSGIPPAPTALALTVVSSYQIDLTWTDNSGSESGFVIQRALDLAFTVGSTTFTVGANVTAFNDTTVQPRNTYYYRVFAFNAAGSSLPTDVASATTPPLPPPVPPSNLVATPSAPAPTPPTVTLTWLDNSNDETGFELQRADDAAFTQGLVSWTLASNTTMLLDATVQPKWTYWYRVRAFNANGVSGWAQTGPVVTPGQVPEAPSNLVVTKVGTVSITLAWLDNSNNENGFYLERSTDGGATWSLRATLPANSTSYKDATVRRTTYWYRVAAFNVDGVSAYTAPVVTTTK